MFVRRDGGACESVEVPSTATVGDLREKANARGSVMSFGGEELMNDDAPLADVGVSAEAVVSLRTLPPAPTIRIQLTRNWVSEEPQVFQVTGATLPEFTLDFARKFGESCNHEFSPYFEQNPPGDDDRVLMDEMVKHQIIASEEYQSTDDLRSSMNDIIRAQRRMVTLGDTSYPIHAASLNRLTLSTAEEVDVARVLPRLEEIQNPPPRTAERPQSNSARPQSQIRNSPPRTEERPQSDIARYVMVLCIVLATLLAFVCLVVGADPEKIHSLRQCMRCNVKL